jgi:hypothetical protein
MTLGACYHTPFLFPRRFSVAARHTFPRRAYLSPLSPSYWTERLAMMDLFSTLDGGYGIKVPQSTIKDYGENRCWMTGPSEILIVPYRKDIVELFPKGDYFCGLTIPLLTL